MQSYDDRDKVVQSGILDNLGTGQSIDELNKILSEKIQDRQGKSIPQQIRELVETAEKKGAVRHVIANMPNQGQEVEIGGLKFKVSYVNNRRGDVHLKLIAIEEPIEDEHADAAAVSEIVDGRRVE